MAGNARFHDKQHRKNHHTLSSYGFPDSGTDPIASPLEPFQGDFVINGALSSNRGFSVLSADIPGDIYCENMYVRSKTYTNFISGVNTETIISDGVLTGYGNNTLTLDYGKAIYNRINNSTIMYLNSSNVGIGTTSPIQRLHVDGNVLITGNLTALGDMTQLDTNVVTTSSMVIDTNGTVDALRITQRGTGNVLIVEDSTNPDSTPFIIDNDGRVGIGISTPSSKLHVNGGLTLEAENYTIPSWVDANNGSSVYIAFNQAGAVNDGAYLRQIGTINNYHLALDMHDDSNGTVGQAFSIRNIGSATNNPDVIQTNFTVSNGGNVGIGTDSPTAKLHIKGAETSPTGGSVGITQLYINNSAPNSSWMRLGVSMFAGDYNPITKTGDQCIIFSGQSNILNSLSSNLVIAPNTSTSSGMRMTYDGKIGIGTATPTDRLQVTDTNGNNGNVTRPAGWSGGITTWDIYAGATIGVGSSSGVLSASMNSSGVIMSRLLAGTGNRAVYSDAEGQLTNTSSDGTLKQNVSAISQGLDQVLQLNPVSFNWINTKSHGPQREIGFIAQEVQQLIPEVIGTNSNGTLSLDYPKMIAVLTKSIQELNDKIESQAKEIAKLKSKKQKQSNI